jgi:glycosyltransferase involved in cell wall biosynthesis
LKRLAIIFDNLGPYHIARLTAAAQYFELLAIEIASVSKDYPWQATTNTPFKRRTLCETHPQANGRKQLTECLDDIIAGHGTEVLVIPGWSGLHTVTGLRIALRRRIPVVLMSESQENDAPRMRIKEMVKQRYLKLCQAALVGGTSNQSYLQNLGFHAERIRLGYDVVDNDYFSGSVNDVKKIGGHLLKQYCLPKRYFLASARFIPKKNLQRLIRAYAEYRSKGSGAKIDSDSVWSLVVLGDGPLRLELEALIARSGLDGFVHLPGFKQYQELPTYYGLASGFVHASTTEQWGLVVNEAMASGLPVLVSERCGCAQDLVENGFNGFTFDPYDVNALAELMSKISSDSCDRTSMGLASQEIISRWTPEKFALGLAEAVEIALTSPRQQVGWLDKALLWALELR